MQLNWKSVQKRTDLPDLSSRVMAFVRGVGPRLAIATQAFEKPWNIIDTDWHGNERQLDLDAVSQYVNLERIPFPQDDHDPSRSLAISILADEDVWMEMTECQQNMVRELVQIQ